MIMMDNMFELTAGREPPVYDASAATSRLSNASSPIRRQLPAQLNSISAMFSQLP